MFEELSRFVEVEAQCGGINLQQLVLRAQSRQWKRGLCSRHKQKKEMRWG
jgi:hypothetical protein